MSTLFIADIHLCEDEPTITAGFLRFLRCRAIFARSLYILGDLFKLWIGDDDPNPLHYEIAIALKKLTQRGIPCYFIHGNRDFLLGKRYADFCGMILLPSQSIIKLDGLNIIVLHGDILCTDDKHYQRCRRWTHQHWVQKLFLFMPLKFRLFIANKIRANSHYANTNNIVDIMDVNPQTVIAIMDTTHTTLMIHGHTHRPAIHNLLKQRYRVVLGSWKNQGSAIELSNNKVILHEFPFSF
ncbi:UDP-2,3-diacylglucosamine hydrolase [secondary endosymbiont of Heteropsylla cubana]|uniref:UDP-2,3-diacylglucosamine hydrolase n=1 Tax=secondary endosymbiont of Heteropsylla cubana TaxID=134287 RepID=J3TZ54_9ENTR|nr:UDP-2,3-diacylglucosamine diphosphatase [secondary endosymbiont of Heteropsylla cubana]AFP85745.1 UDP-2,3-diacylglucosamine hydrolase [secondary endosymbiont of Heteropsylla cubana]